MTVPIRIRRPGSGVWLLILSALLACAPAAPPAADENLLSGVRPSRHARVAHADRIADGVAAQEGNLRLTNLAAQLRTDDAYLEWDLGTVEPIACVLLQGDNNDRYRLAGSEDGASESWTWTAEPAAGAGMRTRQARVAGRARHLRLTVEGGDGSYSVGELALYSTCPAGWPAVELRRERGVSPSENATFWLRAFAGAALLFLLVHRRGAGRWHYLLAAGAVSAGVLAARACAEIQSFANSDQESLVRGIVAGLAAVLVGKESLLSKGHAPHPRVARISRGLLAVLALGCYYHFASLQFYDVSKGRRTLVHTWDMRNYFPTAKYFTELRYDGVYLASLAAYQELAGEGAFERVSHLRFRDLTNYELTTAGRSRSDLDAIRARFSPVRWADFKRDMKYFVDSMGAPDYLGSMRDHGGNATPVWLLGAWAIFRNAPASELTLSLAGLIDPVLLAIFFVILWRSFGERVTLYALILFGASDFYQLGSNLVGSTLRQDWLVALGLGACALKRGRPLLGGFLLGYGGLVRAFPALAAIFLVVPLVWFVVDWLRARGRLPAWGELRSDQGATLHAIAGAAACVVLLVGASSGVLGWSASWNSWFQKIGMHAVGPSTNCVGLRNVLAFRPQQAAKVLARTPGPAAADDVWVRWDAKQKASFAQLRPLYYLLNALAVALAFFACRGRPLHQTALLGLLLVPFLFYPSNYYCHFVFLLPIAVATHPDEPRGSARDRSFALVVLVLCALSLGQYFTYGERWSDLRYTYQSFELLGAFSFILVLLGLEGWRGFETRTSRA